MPSTHALNHPVVPPQTHPDLGKPGKSEQSRSSSKHAREEIGAYIARRDALLAQAEKVTTRASLQRAAIANDLVANCVKPARAPYEAQFLAEADAAHERKRCESAKIRIAELGALRL